MLLGNKIIENGQLVDAFEPSMSSSAVVIYEVIRIIDGVCLFADDHFTRLVNSARLAGERLPLTDQQFIQLLKQLVAELGISEGNIKLVIEYNGGNKNFYFYCIPHYYPSANEYLNGVKTVASKAERPNPNAKILHPEIKQRVDKILADTSIYEVVLFDFDGYITEGSKSNLFFIKDDKIVTAPYNKVLPGVTRKYALQACCKLQLEIDERCLHYKELSSIQGAFISGTSPKILPVSKIDSYSIPVEDPMLRGIMKEYNDIINNYILANK